MTTAQSVVLVAGLVVLIAALAAASADGRVFAYAAETTASTVWRRLVRADERPIPYLLTDTALLVLVDHADCEGGCGQIICCCTGSTTVCPGTVEQECLHLGLFCGECRIYGCEECVIDALFDVGIAR